MGGDCCSGLCGTTLLLLLVGTGLLAAGTATEYWKKDGYSLWTNFEVPNKDSVQLNAVRGCLLAALGCAAIMLLIYFCFCCCNERRRSVLSAQFVLLFLAATGAAAAVVVYGVHYKNDFKDFGWSFWLAVGGAAIYVINLFLVLADCCCCNNRNSV